MRVLVTGGQGQLGTQFASLVHSPDGCVPLDLPDLDVTDAGSVAQVFGSVRPDVVIHCAAWTDVDGCEKCPERAHLVNAEGTRLVALAAEDAQAELVYVSTDFVFDGERAEPYTEDDVPNPINVYGHSKLAGEEWAKSICSRHRIVRTAWLYGKTRRNFVARVLDIAGDRGILRMAADQVGSPTYVGDLAERVMEMLGRAPYGTHHVTNAGRASRYEWACEIVRLAGIQAIVEPISASEWPSPARRPANSSLDDQAMRRAGFPPMRPWQDALAEVVPALTQQTAGR